MPLVCPMSRDTRTNEDPRRSVLPRRGFSALSLSTARIIGGRAESGWTATSAPSNESIESLAFSSTLASTTSAPTTTGKSTNSSSCMYDDDDANSRNLGDLLCRSERNLIMVLKISMFSGVISVKNGFGGAMVDIESLSGVDDEGG